jgi:hypothetical protein
MKSAHEKSMGDCTVEFLSEEARKGGLNGTTCVVDRDREREREKYSCLRSSESDSGSVGPNI